MSKLWRSSGVLVLISVLAVEAAYPVWHPLTVCSRSMGCVRGKHMPGYQTDKFEAFLGIPYAVPPIGPLRFTNPRPSPKWSGTRNTSDIKEDCIQKNHLLPNPVVYGNEDCLYLNVFRPMYWGRRLLPVLVYIHGGGWFSGSASPLMQGPEYLMDTREVVVVTIAYRLGPFGFLSTNDVNMPGNFGLKDQTLALRWVQKNIRAFGGNPKAVTIFGQSAGSISAHMHMLSKQSNGLFHKVVTMSGTANVPFAITWNPLKQARQVAKFCNISDANTLDTANLTHALRSIDATALLNAADGLKYWDVDPLTSFRPVIESYGNGNSAFFAEDPAITLSTGNYEARPWMASFVPHEGAVRATAILENDKLRASFNSDFDRLFQLLMELPASADEAESNATASSIIEEYFHGQHELNNSTGQALMDSITERGFFHPLFNAIKAYVTTIDTSKYPVYLYKFNYRGPYSFTSLYVNGQTSRDYGVVHCDDLLYLFRAPLVFPDFERNSTEALVIKTLVRNLVHFAKNGTPIESDKLEACNSETFNGASNKICDYLEFKSQEHSFIIQTSNEFNVERVQFWNKILGQE